MKANCHQALQRFRTIGLMLLLLGGKTFTPAALSQVCSSAYLAAFATSPIQFTTYNSLINGGTAAQYVNAQINTYQAGVCPNWRLTVRATGNFSNGTKQLDLRYTSIRFNTVVGGPGGSEIGIPANPFVLSQNEVAIIPRSNVPIDVTQYQTYSIKYDLIIQGGNQLLMLTNGEYQTNLVFNLYDERNNLFSTATTRVVFQVYYDANNNTQVKLQNGANNILMQFTTPESIANGITINIPNGLSVLAYSSHQILAKAATSRLVATSEGMSFIPVSTIRLSLTAAGSFGQITCFSIPLSANGQVVADNPMSDYTYQNVFYNLSFAIAGNDPNIAGARAGSYTSSLVLTLVPK